MGTWDTGPFDNDTAADFAADLRSLPTTEARDDYLKTTLFHFIDEPYPPAEIVGVVGFHHSFAEAVAASAFVTDKITGFEEFTDTPFARGVTDDGEPELLPYPELDPPDQILIAMTAQALDKAIALMARDGVDDEWQEPARRIRARLPQG